MEKVECLKMMNPEINYLLGKFEFAIWKTIGIDQENQYMILYEPELKN